MSLYRKVTTDFVGPCAHGRDPYERCDEDDDPVHGGCSTLAPIEVEVLALRARLEVAVASAQRLNASADKAEAECARLRAQLAAMTERAEKAEASYEARDRQFQAAMDIKNRYRAGLAAANAHRVTQSAQLAAYEARIEALTRELRAATRAALEEAANVVKDALREAGREHVLLRTIEERIRALVDRKP